MVFPIWVNTWHQSFLTKFLNSHVLLTLHNSGNLLHFSFADALWEHYSIEIMITVLWNKGVHFTVCLTCWFKGQQLQSCQTLYELPQQMRESTFTKSQNVSARRPLGHNQLFHIMEEGTEFTFYFYGGAFGDTTEIVGQVFANYVWRPKPASCFFSSCCCCC